MTSHVIDPVLSSVIEWEFRNNDTPNFWNQEIELDWNVDAKRLIKV